MKRKWLIAIILTAAICIGVTAGVIYWNNPTNRQLRKLKRETKQMKVVADYKEQQLRIARYTQLLTPDPNTR